MKSRIEILAEVTECSPEVIDLYKDDIDTTVSIKETLKAMKIAMKQTWLIARNWNCRNLEFDEWFNKLEGGKDDTDNTDNH